MNGVCMDGIKRILRVVVFLGIIFVGSVLRVAGQGNDSLVNVSPRKFVHGLRVEGRPEYIFPTSSFLKRGECRGEDYPGSFFHACEIFVPLSPGEC